MSEYSFELTDRNIESTRKSIKSNFNIEVVAVKFASTNLYLEFKCKYGDKRFVIEKIDLKTNASWGEAEHIAYLKGYFGFAEKNELENAVKNLADKLDNNIPMSNFNAKWRDFVDEVAEWYGLNIKPLLDDELNIFNKYAKNANH